MGSFITQIACGRRHTLALIGKTGKLYAFGLGVKGQLGLYSTRKYSTPSLVESKWNPIDSDYLCNMKDNENEYRKKFYFLEDFEALKHELQSFETSERSIRYSGELYYLHQIFGGGLNSFAMLTNPKVLYCYLFKLNYFLVITVFSYLGV